MSVDFFYSQIGSRDWICLVFVVRVLLAFSQTNKKKCIVAYIKYLSSFKVYTDDVTSINKEVTFIKKCEYDNNSVHRKLKLKSKVSICHHNPIIYIYPVMK